MTDEEKQRSLKGDEYAIRCENSHVIRHRHKKPPTKDCLSSSSSIFVTKNLTIITAQTGSTAILPCVLMGFVNGVVSWKRLKDYTLLTVGSTRYTTSNRFVPEQVKSQNVQHWRLLIKFVEHNDAGMYECQVSTYPPAYIHMRLKVIDAYAMINGSPELYIKNGSEMHLTCKFIQSTEEPSFVFWYHENMMINFDQYRGISTFKNKSTSSLTIATINHSHSGNYSCVPSNMKPASISVHILDDEKPAAMHTDNRNFAPTVTKPKIYSAFVIIMYISFSFFYLFLF
ncbi:limbic system-associated membrane protein-like [Planococcus citri]|uniref:limbic system-associated membrane protein-like n=1 Tax=Planococcus citri TaxID=170843 RepID=UPI0031F78872